MKNKLLIAVDGPAASGKGTLARKLATHFGIPYLDTGKLYRYVGYQILKKNIDPESCRSGAALKQAIDIANKIQPENLNEKALNSEESGRAASIISGIPEIRAALLEFQRNIAKSPAGAVLDGRDIGTVVCPEADFKLFVTASLTARAKRRYKELQSMGLSVIYPAVLEDLQARDERDSLRKISPLVPAKGAIHIDTTDMDEAAVFEKALSIIMATA